MVNCSTFRYRHDTDQSTFETLNYDSVSTSEEKNSGLRGGMGLIDQVCGVGEVVVWRKKERVKRAKENDGKARLRPAGNARASTAWQKP